MHAVNDMGDINWYYILTVVVVAFGSIPKGMLCDCIPASFCAVFFTLALPTRQTNIQLADAMYFQATTKAVSPVQRVFHLF